MKFYRVYSYDRFNGSTQVKDFNNKIQAKKYALYKTSIHFKKAKVIEVQDMTGNNHHTLVVDELFKEE